MKRNFLFMLFLSMFLFLFVCCKTQTNDVLVKDDQSTQEITKPSDKEDKKPSTPSEDTKVPEEEKPTPKPDIKVPEEEKPTPQPKPENTEDTSESIPEDNNNGIKPFPGAITDNNILKLKLKIDDKADDGYMYLMLRFMGVSEKGAWKQVYDEKTSREQNVYPRGFVLGYENINTKQYTETNLNGYDQNQEPLPGIGYTKESGFNSDGQGNYLVTKFYYGDENMRCKISSNNDLTFQFQNFVIIDPLVQGELMGHPDFVRYPSGYPLKINVPMKDYDPTIHKNIAYITIYFEPDKGNVDNMFPYQAVLDGFENR